MPGPRPYMPPRPMGQRYHPYPQMGYPPGPGYPAGGYDSFWSDDYGPGPQAGFGRPPYAGAGGRGRGGFRGRGSFTGGPGPMRGRGGQNSFRGAGKRTTIATSPSKNGGPTTAHASSESGLVPKIETPTETVSDNPDAGVKISGDSTSVPVMIAAKPENRFVAGGEMKSFSDTVIEAKTFIGPTKPGEVKIELTGQMPQPKKHFVVAGKPVAETPKPSVPAAEKIKDPLYNAEESWPEDLMDKFSEFECLLCGSKMNSRMIAKTHYDGKTHEKKLRMYFSAYKQNTGMPLYYYMKRKERKPPAPVSTPTTAPVAVTTATPSGVTAADDTTPVPATGTSEAKAVDASTHELYCNICQISFTSQSHKVQHEQGRNHQRKAAGLPPLKTGYFNPVTGRWHRMPTWETNKRIEENESANFAPIGGGGSTQSGKTYATDDGQQLKNLAKLVPAETDTTIKYIFECKLCAVTAPTQAQLDVHLQGQKHRFKVNQKERIEKQLEDEKKGIRRPKPYDRNVGGPNLGGPKRFGSGGMPNAPSAEYTQKWWTTPATVQYFN